MAKIKNTQILRTILFVLIVLLLCSFASGNVIYVDGDAVGANNGTSWENAYVYLQDAFGALGEEIRVAEGIYRPDESILSSPIQTDKRQASFIVRLGIVIKGGYAGLDHPDPNERDVELYETVLSGDLDADDVDVIDPCDLIAEPTRAENSYNVLNLYGSSWTPKEPPVIDGFTIEGGNANQAKQGRSPSIFVSGGGMRIWLGGIKLINCTFRNNSAITSGGAVACRDGDHEFNNCTFVNNWAGSGGAVICTGRGESTFNDCSFVGNSGSSGGAVVIDGIIATLSNCTFFNNVAKFDGGVLYDSQFSKTKLTNCLLKGNLADRGGCIFSEATDTNMMNCIFNSNLANKGGGIYPCLWGSVTVHDCAFVGNSAKEGGGVFNHWGSRTELTNCRFMGNSAEDSGGGIFNQPHCEPKILNCTFAGNSAPNGNALACDSLSDPNGSSDVSVINCIFGGEENEIWKNDASTIIVTYSNIHDGFPGEGNIHADPCFVNPGYWDTNSTTEDVNDDFWVDGDYHLKSQTGRWDPNSGSWVQDDVTSPCIDAGDPNSDFSGETWPHGGRINMGAYGGTREASMSAETEGMFLPNIVYIFFNDTEAAEDFESLLEAYGCQTTIINMNEVTATPLDFYDLVIIGNDTGLLYNWADANSVAAIEDLNKPIIGLGEGGYSYFGQLGLAIGYPNGGHNDQNSIKVIDPNSSLFSTPYIIEIQEDQTLQLYPEIHNVAIYFWPLPENITGIGIDVDELGYYPLVLEQDRYLLWGFEGPPDKMTEIGKTLFINVVIWTANKAWESES